MSSGNRQRAGRLAAAALALLLFQVPGGVDAAADPVAEGARLQVVLLHGLARHPASMKPMARALEDAGHATCNVAYPSRRHSIEVLARRHVAPAIGNCGFDAGRPLHFVTHSMGGIVVRQLVADRRIANLGRVVMLAPPNGGSELVDRMESWHLFRTLGGPAGGELSTAASSSPQRLGAASFELGVIIGTRSLNPVLSMTIPGEDDGKVSVERARLDGMRDFLSIDTSHPLIMRNREAQRQTVHFLSHGRFAPRDGPRRLTLWR